MLSNLELEKCPIRDIRTEADRTGFGDDGGDVEVDPETVAVGWGGEMTNRGALTETETPCFHSVAGSELVVGSPVVDTEEEPSVDVLVVITVSWEASDRDEDGDESERGGMESLEGGDDDN